MVTSTGPCEEIAAGSPTMVVYGAEQNAQACACTCVHVRSKPDGYTGSSSC
jgi:hypothetical protein